MINTTTKAGALVAAIFLLAATNAKAQKFSDVAQQLDTGDRPAVVQQQSRTAPIRVQVTYQLQWPVGLAQSLDDQKTAITRVHAAFYDLASHECDQLKSLAGGDCRLASLNIGNTGYPQSNPAATFQANATATFEVTPPALPAPNQAPAPKP